MQPNGAFYKVTGAHPNLESLIIIINIIIESSIHTKTVIGGLFLKVQWR